MRFVKESNDKVADALKLLLDEAAEAHHGETGLPVYITVNDMEKVGVISTFDSFINGHMKVVFNRFARETEGVEGGKLTEEKRAYMDEKAKETALKMWYPVSAERLASLLQSEVELNHLVENGVDNWSGYSLPVDEHKEIDDLASRGLLCQKL